MKEKDLLRVECMKGTRTLRRPRARWIISVELSAENASF